MNKKSSELNVITKTKDLSEYVFAITHKSPKEFRFTIVVKMQNYCLEAMDNLYRANDVTLKKENIQKREDFQRAAMTAFRLLVIAITLQTSTTTAT